MTNKLNVRGYFSGGKKKKTFKIFDACYSINGASTSGCFVLIL